MLSGWLSWALATAVVLVIVGGSVWLFRSFRRWQQPPPGTDARAESAESFLSWMTRTRGDKG